MYCNSWSSMVWQCCVSIYLYILPRLISHGILLFIQGKGRRTFKIPECGMTFGAIKHSVYETGTGARYEQVRDFVKIALPCSLKAIRSISHVAHAIFIRFYSTLRRCEIKDEVHFRIVYQSDNRSKHITDLWTVFRRYCCH